MVGDSRLREVAKAASATLVLVATLTVVFALFASKAENQVVSPDLLNQLKLSGYPTNMRPPGFHGFTADGQVVSMQRLLGKVVLITFWATWCLECRSEMPAFERLHRELAPQGLSVLGINAREGSVAIRNYATELSLTFPLVLDPRGKINAAYGVIGLPTTFIIGRDGRAVALAVGPREWASPLARAIIQALLAETPVLKGKQ